MRTILGRKQRIENDQWLEAIAHIEELVPYNELQLAAKSAIADIRAVSATQRVAFGWSGGKDSIVLADICRRAGVTKCMFAHSNLEYPAFLKWCLENKPLGCEVINTGQDLDWLVKHPEMLFPKGKELCRWYQIVQRKAFTEYFFRNELDMLLVGHRKADGNVVGEGNVIRKNSGEVRYAPIADWTHEMMLAYIHYFNLELPPIYGWKNGYRCGTHPWPSRMHTDSIQQGFDEVYEIDPTIVIQAAQKLESARLYLARRYEK